MKAYEKFIENINKVTAALVIALLAILVVIVLLAVFYRYVLNDSITWSAEVARYMCIWVGFLSASLVLYERGHIGLEFFIQKASVAHQHIVRCICDVAVLVFLIIVLILGIQLSIFQLSQYSPALMISMVWPYASVPVAAFLMSLQAVLLIMKDLKGTKEA